MKKLLILFALLPLTVFAQHTISGTFTPAEDFNFVILYRVTPTTSLYVNSSEVNKENGSFKFELDDTQLKGMYRIVYALPQEEFNFDVIYSGDEDVELDFKNETGVTYKTSKDNVLLASYTESVNLINEDIQKLYAQDKPSKKEFKKVFSALADIQTEFEDASKGMLASHFIKASKPYIPESFEDAKTFSKHLQSEYFKNIDFGDSVLQNSSFLIDASINYALNFIDKSDENKSLKSNIDDVAKAIGNNPEIKQIILKIFWNQFADGKNEAVANYITNKYLLELLSPEKDKDFINTITVFKNASVGAKAPNFEYQVEDIKNDKTVTKTLHKLDSSQRYIIVFWSSTCSHCLDELPKLKSYLSKSNKEEITTIAIGLEDEPYRWNNETTRYPDFIHVYGEGKWENPIGDAYNVTATPGFFILDQDKTIIAKPEDVEDLQNYFKARPITLPKAKDTKTETQDAKE